MSGKNEKAVQDRNAKMTSLNTEYGHRVIFKAMGFTSEELSMPRIAVVNSWSEQSPGHSHLRALSEGVKAGIRMAGGMPFEINVIGPCTVLGGNFHDASFDLPQREAIVCLYRIRPSRGLVRRVGRHRFVRQDRSRYAHCCDPSEPPFYLHRRWADAALRLRR